MGVTILQLPQATGLTGNEQIEGVQGNASVRIPLSAIAAQVPGVPGPPGPPGPTTPFPTTTPAEITAGVTVVNTNYSEGDIRRYATSPGTGGDDFAAINATLAVAAQSGRPAFFSGLNLKSSGSIVRDVGSTGVDFLGGGIDFTSMGTSGTAWQDTCTTGTGSAQNVRHARYPMMNGYLSGQNTGTTVGLSINDTGEPSASFLNYHNMVVEQFNTALLIGSNSYILKFFGCYFSRSGTGLNLPGGLTNAAEQIVFTGCGFTDCSINSINNGANNTDLVLVGCSLDGNNITYYTSSSNARTYMYGCHVECLNAAAQAVPMFNVSGDLVFSAGAILADGTGPMPASTVFSISSGSRAVLTDRPLLNNLQNSGGVMCSGAGNINILSPIKTFDSTLLPVILGVESNFNLLEDGGFENAAVSDNIGVVGDVTFTATASTASPTVINATNHRQIVGQSGYFTTSGTMPTGLPANTILYVSTVVDSANFNVTYPSGSAVNVTGSGTGTLTYHAVPLSRLTGSHISLANSTAAHNTGTQSLAATLNGGLGASYIIAVPCQPGHFYGIQGFYDGASNAATSFSLTPAFASDMGYVAGGTLSPIGQVLQSGAAVNVGSVSNAGFVKFNCALVLAPSWAKYFYLLVNLNNLFNNTLYLDDLVVTAY